MFWEAMLCAVENSDAAFSAADVLAAYTPAQLASSVSGHEKLPVDGHGIAR
ncbi:hypothetical protein Asphe3_06510 [Pseudarthrobacter phenanthrenivorans Sphe3]|uniref:Uncharacterized protein n=1 Tax=Pseudarthrobacter phenanthrenivorans (strain DSM 18606 / JCM 16027 / LMG 23796 / Sphe3) TaxID=930171 RepID=F0MBH8_PSEPM|nr:hypothetical protein Asphe3_06510 [Pseudarthrobacter phenanthrenivorans Sphe3]